jgi:HAD superfamily hydrolase (TIGR01509 family)
VTGALSAVLWDMDGLLVDTEPVWTVAEEELACELGGVWSEQLKAAIVGTRLDVAIPLILEHYGREATTVEVAWASEWLLNRMVELFSEGVVALPGAVELLTTVAEAGVPQVLVSSSYRVLVDSVLSHGFGPFVLTLAGDEVVHGKPHPEPYLTAASRLGVDPARCVVLEDSSAGVLSAQGAGCAAVAVPSVEGVAFVARPRLAVRSSLAGLSVCDLEGLVS